MASSDSSGNGENSSGCVRVWRARVWCVRCEVMDVCAVMSLIISWDILVVERKHDIPHGIVLNPTLPT